MTLKEIKDLYDLEDITAASDDRIRQIKGEGAIDTLSSSGKNGINGMLIITRKNVYRITSRCANIFKFWKKGV